MVRNLKNLGKRFLRAVFEIGQRLRVDILPRHFYSEIPDIRVLKRETSWKFPRSMTGINGSELESQLQFVRECCPKLLRERIRKGDIYPSACLANEQPGFGPVEADFLFCFISTKRPKRIVQVGCGVSTAVIITACHEASYRPEIICVDPFPTAFLKRCAQKKEICLLASKAQDIPLDRFTDLGDKGFLFVDSTHTVKPGSEVNQLIFEVLPRLSAGSVIHFHDIYFPFDYQRSILSDDLFFQNESNLLLAFLTYNEKFTLKVSLSMLHYSKPKELGQVLATYRPAGNDFGLKIGAGKGHFPSSAYIEVIQ